MSGNCIAVAEASASAVPDMWWTASRSRLTTLAGSPAFWASMTARRVVACVVMASSTTSAGRFWLTELRVSPNVLAYDVRRSTAASLPA